MKFIFVVLKLAISMVFGGGVLKTAEENPLAAVILGIISIFILLWMFDIIDLPMLIRDIFN